MKKVVSPETVAHLFANQLQDEARTPANNFSFNGTKIYSYSTCIAKFVTNSANETKLLFTLNGYSNTTRKQLAILRSATSHLDKLDVWEVSSYGQDHEKDFRLWLYEAETIGKKLIRANKPTIYLSQLDTVKEQVTKYCSFFGIEPPKPLLEVLQVANSADFAKYNEQKETFLAIEKAKKEKALNLKIKKELKEWRSFEVARMYTRNEFDYLRYNKDKNRIETSQNIEVPVAIAQKAYNWIVKKDTCNTCNHKIMDFEVKELTKDYLLIGCHKITIKEINLMAKKLGWV